MLHLNDTACVVSKINYVRGTASDLILLNETRLGAKHSFNYRFRLSLALRTHKSNYFIYLVD